MLTATELNFLWPKARKEQANDKQGNILDILEDGPILYSELCEILSKTKPTTVSYYLASLKKKGLE